MFGRELPAVVRCVAAIEDRHRQSQPGRPWGAYKR